MLAGFYSRAQSDEPDRAATWYDHVSTLPLRSIQAANIEAELRRDALDKGRGLGGDLTQTYMKNSERRMRGCTCFQNMVHVV